MNLAPKLHLGAPLGADLRSAGGSVPGQESSICHFPSADFLNQHPLNQHALKLLPGWSLRPIPGQLHILTLASAALFATAPQKTALAHLRAAPPEIALAHFLQVAAFDALYMREDRPLESTHLILAASTLFEN